MAKVASHVNEMAEQKLCSFFTCLHRVGLARFHLAVLRVHYPGHLRKHWAALCRRSDLTHGRNAAQDDRYAASK